MESNDLENAEFPESLVTKGDLQRVLELDKGSEARLLSFTIDNFTKVGDNFASLVNRIRVTYSLKDNTHDTSYIVKLSHKRESKDFNEMNKNIFTKESKFYENMIPILNDVLESIGQPPLRFPKCFYSSTENFKERIYFEDLKTKGFRLFSGKDGMDIEHVNLVLQELARLHASSFLLQKKHQEPIEWNHDYLMINVFTSEVTFEKLFKPMFFNSLSSTVAMLQSMGGYENAVKWVENLKQQLMEIFTTYLQNGIYDVVCHGDCWKHNMLFRYSSNGSPVDVMFLDLQVCRKASPTTDLNYFLYTSTTSVVRRPNLKAFLKSYYNYFKEVTDAGSISMPFSEEEIQKEFQARNKLGALFGICFIVMEIIQSSDAPDVDNLDNDFVKIVEEANQKAKILIHTNTKLRGIVKGLFDELIENGVIQ